MRGALAAAVTVLSLLLHGGVRADDLASWNEGPAKAAILDFVADVTTPGGPGRRFGLIVRHDDAEREYAYDRDSLVGRLDQALDAAPAAGWTVVSIKNDGRTVFPEP